MSDLQVGGLAIALMLAGPGAVLTATANGYGKRTRVDEFPLHNRGGQGVIAIQTTERNGAVVAASLVDDDSELMLISNSGVLVRTRAAEVSMVGRNTQGVRLIQLDPGAALVGVQVIEGGNGGDDVPEDNDEPGPAAGDPPTEE